MHSKLAFIVASAALLESASAHVRFMHTYGNVNENHFGWVIGHESWIKAQNHGNGQWPGQFDTVVFGNPTIPACCWAPDKYKKFPRYWMDQGCGTTLEAQNLFYRKNPWREGANYLEPKYHEQSQQMMNHRNYHFFMAPIDMGAFLPTRQIMDWQASTDRMALASPGGWVEIATYQVNADGAGPFRCRVDTGATSHGFGRWLEVSRQPPGRQDWYSVDAGRSNTWSNLRVQIPTDLKCTGKAGKYENVCLLRCENYAQNGPFGGCVPFNVVYPKTEHPPAPKHEPPPPKQHVGYNIQGANPEAGYSQYYKGRKRDVEQKQVRRAANADPEPVAEPEPAESEAEAGGTD
ncbi:hypothetical protein TWF481_008509 [Arthrobotrys musiformis]|uniref:Uncharacterized protein n=1 Tax=Arthrobotrys musiformis TaxID=47236 RepID=A0AAV9W977_9PEZI